MWLLPRLRLPFGTAGGFFRWFLTGINLWAVGAVVVCAVAGWALLERFAQPRQLGVEQALAGGQGTAGLSYRVERTGESEATVTGSWDPEKDQEEPGPALAAALCAALSPEEIYGHSDYLYRAIAGEFFDGKDFDLTIRLQQVPDKGSEEEPEPVFSVTRKAGEDSWPQPECDAAFAREWRERYSQYWLFGQGRKEEMGPPQSDPVFEEGDLPPEEGEGDSEDEEAPPLPDLDGEGEPEQSGSSQPEDDPPDSSSGSSSDREPPPPEDDRPRPEPEGWLEKLLVYARQYRGLSWEEAWELFWKGEDEGI